MAPKETPSTTLTSSTDAADAASPSSSSTKKNDHQKTNPASQGLPAATAAYLVIWCLHALLPLIDTKVLGVGVGAYDSRPLCRWDFVFLYPLVVPLFVLLVSPSTTMHNKGLMLKIAVLNHAVDFAIRYHRMPALWDHEYWGILTELAFVVAYSPCIFPSTSTTRAIDAAETLFLSLVRWQFGLLYTAAAFWKLNSSFFDLQLSCGTLLTLELVGSYLEPLAHIPISVVKSMAQTAPHVTVLGESSIALCFLVVAAIPRRSSVRNLGIALGLFFHTSILMLPVNAAGGFSMACISRFICFFDTDEIEQSLQVFQSNGAFRVRASVQAMVVAVGLGVARYKAIDVLPDAELVSCGILIVFYSWLSQTINDQDTETRKAATREKEESPWVSTMCVLALTVSYGFVFPILGVQQMGASTMYGNLRNYGPSNHYLVPTAILDDDILFGGGLVQVVHSTSDRLNLQFGHIQSTNVFPHRVLRLLAMARHGTTHISENDFPVQFFPYCMVSHHSRGQLKDAYLTSKQALGRSKATSIPYILPISAVSAALHEAVQAGEEFAVTLADARTSDDVNIVKNDAATTQIEIKTNFKCRVIRKGGDGVDCATNSLATRILSPKDAGGFAGALAKKLLIPYPRLVEPEGEVCVT